MARLLLPLLSVLLVSLSTQAQQMQEFNQLYFEKERANAIKVAKAALVNAANNDPSANAFLVAHEAASKSLGSKAPVLANELAAEITNPDSKTSNAISAFNALPSFTSLFSNSITVPKIELAATTNFNSKKNVFYLDVHAFTSTTSPKQTTNVNLFFPETSSYGIIASFNVLPLKEIHIQNKNGDEKEINWLCLYGSMSYLGKSLFGLKKNDNATIDTTRFKTDFTHLKLGVQLIPIGNLISFYGDVNFLAPLTNRAMLLRYNPAINAGFSNFWNIGTKVFLATGADKPLGVYLDLSFIIVDQITQTLHTIEDPVIPKIAIGSSFRF